MLKRLLVVVFLISTSGVIGCSGGSFLDVEEEGVNIKLEISRSIKGVFDPFLVVLAEKVTFDYSKREITVGGLVNFTGNDSGIMGYSWVLPRVSIQDNKLILKIPDDNPYHVYIGGNYHYLPVVKEK
jgi:hypothetical protein